MTPRAVLFDLDGTLVDSLGDIAAAMNAALAALGQPVHADYRRLVGDGVDTLARRALPPGREDLASALVAEYRARYAARMLETTRPYPGVTALLEALAARGVPMAVLSNKPDAATREVVRALLPGVAFRAVVGQRPGVPHKPDPASALEVARALGVAPGEVAFVGDTNTDMRTARAAGMRPVGALWGFRDRAELVAAGATDLLAAPGELLRFFA